MKKTIVILFLISLSRAFGQTSPVPEEVIKAKGWSQAISRAEHFIDSLRIRQDIPGVSVCVGTMSGILWAEGFGFADVEAKVPVSIHSRFRMGSVSKSLTSAAIGRLVQDKKLDIDAPVQNYVKAFPVKQYPFTTRQLATHTAGIRHYRNNDPVAFPKRYLNVTEGLSIFSQDSLLFRPGTSYNYSTYGYTLLSAVIEQAAHTDYLSFMQQAVFTPLGMTETGADYSDSIVLNRVRFYEHSNKKLVNAALVDNSYKWAGGGLLSTPSDLVRFATGLLKNTILKKETTALLFTPQVLENGSNTNYGFGWRLGTGYQNKKIIHHGGTIDGGRTFLLIYPEDDLVVAIAANMSGVNINIPEAEKIATYFFQIKQ